MAISDLSVGPELLAEAEAEALGGGAELTRRDRDQARRAAENLARRGKDLEKLNDLALQDYTGPEYEIFAGELAAYAYPVLLAWLRRAVIFKYCADKGRTVRPTDADRDVLAGSFEERLQLALETVAEALTFFRSYVLRGRHWSYDGGASVTTYFIGSCLFAFPNVFRRWQSEQRRWRQGLAVEMLNCPEGRGRTLADQQGGDPADVVVGRVAVLDALNAMPSGTRDAAALIIDGQSFAEAAEHLGTTDRGIEGRLYRYRTARGQHGWAKGRDL
jgi:DNA-directed RNA polymerase specialized sigma24 family protein